MKKFEKIDLMEAEQLVEEKEALILKNQREVARLRQQIHKIKNTKFIMMLTIEEKQKLLDYATSRRMFAAEVIRRYINTLEVED